MENGGMIEILEGCIDWSTYRDVEIDEEGCESEGEEYVKIDNLVVKKEFRGQGYGKKLLESAIQLIRKQYPDHRILIVPEGKDGADSSRLAAFYSRYPELEVFVC